MLFDSAQQSFPSAIQGTAKTDQDRQRCSKLCGFDELESTRSNVRFFRQLLLSQTRLLAQPPEISAQDFELLLRNALHWAFPC